MTLMGGIRLWSIVYTQPEMKTVYASSDRYFTMALVVNTPESIHFIYIMIVLCLIKNFMIGKPSTN